MCVGLESNCFEVQCSFGCLCTDMSVKNLILLHYHLLDWRKLLFPLPSALYQAVSISAHFYRKQNKQAKTGAPVAQSVSEWYLYSKDLLTYKRTPRKSLNSYVGNMSFCGEKSIQKYGKENDF